MNCLPCVLLAAISVVGGELPDAASGHPEVARRSLTTRSRLRGVAKPKLSATLRFLVAGTISELHVSEGDPVREGQPLVTLDDRLARARLRLAEISARRVGELQHAEVQLKFGERQLSRLENLHARNAVSELELEEQRALVQRARAVHKTQLEALELAGGNKEFAEQQLRHMTLFAPFDGIVTQLHQKLGAPVDTTTPVISVANLKTLQVEMHTPIDRYGRLLVGHQVNVRAGAPVNALLPASVVTVSPMINAASSTFRCRLEIRNDEGQLPAGFAVSLESD